MHKYRYHWPHINKPSFYIELELQKLVWQVQEVIYEDYAVRFEDIQFSHGWLNSLNGMTASVKYIT